MTRNRIIAGTAMLALAIWSGPAPAQTTLRPAAQPSTSQSSTTMPANPPAAATSARPAATPGAAGALRQYKTEAEAKSACGTDTVTWANPRSRVLHAAGTRYYGKTAQGGYVCHDLALKAGYHDQKGR